MMSTSPCQIHLTSQIRQNTYKKIHFKDVAWCETSSITLSSKRIRTQNTKYRRVWLHPQAPMACILVCTLHDMIIPSSTDHDDIVSPRNLTIYGARMMGTSIGYLGKVWSFSSQDVAENGQQLGVMWDSGRACSTLRKLRLPRRTWFIAWKRELCQSASCRSCFVRTSHTHAQDWERRTGC